MASPAGGLATTLGARCGGNCDRIERNEYGGLPVNCWQLVR